MEQKWLYEALQDIVYIWRPAQFRFGMLQNGLKWVKWGISIVTWTHRTGILQKNWPGMHDFMHACI